MQTTLRRISKGCTRFSHGCAMRTSNFMQPSVVCVKDVPISWAMCCLKEAYRSRTRLRCCAIGHPAQPFWNEVIPWFDFLLQALYESVCRCCCTLYKLDKKNATFVWGTQQGAFDWLKEMLISAPRRMPTDECKFYLDCDASHVRLGAVLSQNQDSADVVIERV